MEKLMKIVHIDGENLQRFSLESRLIVTPHPSTPPIVNFSIFFHPEHLYSNSPYY